MTETRQVVSIRLTPATVQELDRIAKANGSTRTTVIEGALFQAWDHYPEAVPDALQPEIDAALGRGVIPVRRIAPQEVRTAPPSPTSTVECPHPKEARISLKYMSKCGACGDRLL